MTTRTELKKVMEKVMIALNNSELAMFDINTTICGEVQTEVSLKEILELQKDMFEYEVIKDDYAIERLFDQISAEPCLVSAKYWAESGEYILILFKCEKMGEPEDEEIPIGAYFTVKMAKTAIKRFVPIIAKYCWR